MKVRKKGDKHSERRAKAVEIKMKLKQPRTKI